ncbi:MAG TPA: hypothetical protein VM406_07425, partial [Noviherbaspirillum sp.]|nr:hypothetical protein [Noviherbaspirillum sp.]
GTSGMTDQGQFAPQSWMAGFPGVGDGGPSMGIGGGAPYPYPMFGQMPFERMPRVFGRPVW